MDFIIIATFVCSLISLLFLIKKRQGESSQILLMLFYIVVMSIFLNYYSSLHQISWLYIITNIFSLGSGYLIGAIIYLYTYSLFEALNAKKIILAFFPFLLFLIGITIPFAFSSPADGYLFDYLEYIDLHGDKIYLLELFVFFLFIANARQKHKQHSSHLTVFYSHVDNSQVKWVRQLLTGILIFITIDFLLTVYLIISHAQNFHEEYFTATTAAFIIFHITYYGLFQSQIFVPNNILKIEKEQKELPSQKSNFSIANTNKLNEKLDNLLKERKLYLNPILTLSDLAKEINISDKKLSAFINQRLQTNFYELINRYRLEEFKNQIQDPKNEMFSLMAIANQCGFKSKTSFYAYFKKHTGMTPSQFSKKKG